MMMAILIKDSCNYIGDPRNKFGQKKLQIWHHLCFWVGICELFFEISFRRGWGGGSQWSAFSKLVQKIVKWCMCHFDFPPRLDSNPRTQDRESVVRPTAKLDRDFCPNFKKLTTVADLWFRMQHLKLEFSISKLPFALSLPGCLCYKTFYCRKRTTKLVCFVTVVHFCTRLIIAGEPGAMPSNRGMYHCTVDLLFDWYDNWQFFSLFAKQTNPNQWYFPFSIPCLKY